MTAVKEGEAGEFDLLGRKFNVWHGINYTQVFESGDAEELLHFHGKRLTVGRSHHRDVRLDQGPRGR
jgi:hypothetical protein